MNMKNALTRLALVGLIGGTTVLTSGCWEIVLGIELLASSSSGSDPYASDPYTSDPYPYYDADGGTYTEPSTIDFTTQSLSGDLGPRTFDGGVWMESGYDDGYYASLEVHAHDQTEDWRVMTRLDVQGGLAHPDLVPGAVLTYRYDEPDYSGTRAYVSLLGCSGAAPEDSSWDFDQSADQVTVEVQEGSTPDQRVLHFVGTWSDGSIVDGTVEYQVE